MHFCHFRLLQFYNTTMKKIAFIFFFITSMVTAQTNNFTYFNKVFEADTMNLLAQVVKPIDDGYLVLGGYITLNTKALYVMGSGFIRLMFV